jgi:hypothetical protein
VANPVLGGIFGFIAVLLRGWLGETTVFQEMQKQGLLPQGLPLWVAIRDHPKAVLAAILSTCILISGVVVVLLMTPTLLQKSFGLVARETQWANLAAIVAGASLLQRSSHKPRSMSLVGDVLSHTNHDLAV